MRRRVAQDPVAQPLAGQPAATHRRVPVPGHGPSRSRSAAGDDRSPGPGEACGRAYPSGPLAVRPRRHWPGKRATTRTAGPAGRARPCLPRDAPLPRSSSKLTLWAARPHHLSAQPPFRGQRCQPGRQKKLGPPPERGRPQRKYVRRRPTLPRGPPRSTIGAEGLNFRVRNGTGCFPFAMATETLWRCQGPHPARSLHSGPGTADRTSGTAQWTRSAGPGDDPWNPAEM